MNRKGRWSASRSAHSQGQDKPPTAGLDSEPPGQREPIGVSRPMGGSPHFSPLEVSLWLVLPIVPLLFGSLILRLSAGLSAPGAASASASPVPSVLYLLLRLMLARSVPAWPVIWLQPVPAPSAGLSFASSNGRPSEPKKKEPRKRLCLILILLETTASAQQSENVGAARENSDFEGWN
jgi:hypothetical protein